MEVVWEKNVKNMWVNLELLYMTKRIGSYVVSERTTILISNGGEQVHYGEIDKYFQYH